MSKKRFQTSLPNKSSCKNCGETLYWSNNKKPFEDEGLVISHRCQVWIDQMKTLKHIRVIDWNILSICLLENNHDITKAKKDYFLIRELQGKLKGEDELRDSTC